MRESTTQTVGKATSGSVILGKNRNLDELGDFSILSGIKACSMRT